MRKGQSKSKTIIKRCKVCGASKEDTYASCENCRELQRRYNEEHKEERRAKAKKYREKNAEHISKQVLAYYYENREERLGYSKEYQSKHKERAKELREKYKNDPETQRKRKNARLVKEYGITLEEYEKMVEDQNNCCAICGISFEPRKPEGSLKLTPVVDHCHHSGEVRKIIHNCCNIVLGMSGESPEILRKAASYLEEHLHLKDLPPVE